eukprot:CAMPEP_0185254662 /NCGR_PEP_ID=MMETSP1359-20130426/3548_1 /TAXON_ID=552665 /ORGANISM="Bigelowiella longifila, Strain CCMP242" /LENGTH=223 /DNA_ID=CAMNT_0027837915 /DNA_START=27 /DNA_END=698 /DNA_ORIENTATION=-
MEGKIKFTYFGIPGRGEPTRLALWIGKKEFEDVHIEFKDWAKLKPTAPWGTLPFLELANGKKIGQTRSCTRFACKSTGLYPEDPYQAALCDDIFDILEDVQKIVNDTGKGQEKEDKLKARKEVVTSGKAADLLKKIEAFISENGKDGHAVGNKMTMADIAIFSYGTMLVCGFFDGIPKDLYSSYPKLNAVRKTVGSHPQVIARYEAEKSENPIWKVFSSVKDL